MIKQGRKKKWIALTAAGALLVLILVPPTVGVASELDQVNKRLQELQRQVQEAEDKQQEADAQKAKAEEMMNKTTKDLNYVVGEIEKKTKEMLDVTLEVDKTEANLEEAAQELEDIKRRIANREKLLDSRVQLMYTNGAVSYIDVLFNATSFSDFVDRLDSMQTIASRDKEILTEHKRDKELAVVQKQEIETELKRVKLLYAKLNEAKKSLQLKENEKKVMIASYEQQVEDNHGVSKEQERLLMEFAKERAELIRKKNELNAQHQGQTSQQVYTYTGGKLGLPLQADYYISSPFGSRVDPITGVSGAFHSGIDMATPGGTPIYAAEDGAVIVAEWYGGYGNCVILDHGNGLWTLYGHIRSGGIKVQKGDTVKRGDKIAEVGQTGRATGNHLHFEVRLNGEQVNPSNYLK
ncbi:membrane protein [Paenibacillus popilliae ATCC 14706]|uniref:Membrane protein n=1 Tax=Paenibacillus popilliae ATCC 14706 TaxID=1212764 RepID=M9M2H9_PAEPP|nr:membrane protein [Paenibacillus popilliae ATCC 14706]